MNLNVLIAGVGGQGNLFASSLLAEYFIKEGYHVLAVETIGAAQRGGSVVSHLRVSDADIYSPLIPAGKVDIILGFETLEMLRNFALLDSEGKYLLNDYKEPTVLCNLGLDTYPSNEIILAALRKSGKKGYVIKGTECARKIGGNLLTNVVMVGALCQLSPIFDKQRIMDILASKSPPKTRKLNLEAFAAGISLMSEAMRL